MAGRPRRRLTQADIVVPVAWAAATAAALVFTLASLRKDDFDGLNNIYQLPLAFPWVILPVGTANHELNAWVMAGMGLANALVLHLWLRRRRTAGG